MKLQGKITTQTSSKNTGNVAAEVCAHSEETIALQTARFSLAATFHCGFMWQKEADKVASLPNDLHLTFTL